MSNKILIESEKIDFNGHGNHNGWTSQQKMIMKPDPYAHTKICVIKMMAINVSIPDISITMDVHDWLVSV